MIFTKLFVALLLSLVADLNGEIVVPTCAEVFEMKGALISKMEQDEFLQPAALRLGFHSCVGGCNGCIDLHNPLNKGLERAISYLNELHRTYNFKVSLADFYALAAVVAVERGIHLSNENRVDGKSCPQPCFDELWGRVDVKYCGGDILPGAHFTHPQMMNYFAREFGFSKQEVVALMGAHSLGGAKRENSGFSGYWTKGEKTHFDEKYYRNMIDPQIKWENVDASMTNENKWEFNGTRVSDGKEVSFMLNVDFNLFYDLKIDRKTGKTLCKLDHTCGEKPTCAEDNCQMSKTHKQAHKYAQNCSNFINDFSMVFQKMLTHGYNLGNLQKTHCQC